MAAPCAVRKAKSAVPLANFVYVALRFAVQGGRQKDTVLPSFIVLLLKSQKQCAGCHIFADFVYSGVFIYFAVRGQ